MQSEKIPAEEARAFIERVIASEPFKKKKGLQSFLLFLLDRREELLSSIQLEELLFLRRRTSGDLNEDHARERASALRRALKKYEGEHPDDPIRCELPNADEISGYQIRFQRVTDAASACSRFWAAHLESEKQISVVLDPLLFFFDFESLKVFRLMDVNIEGVSRDAAKAELLKKREKEHSDSLIPGHLYFDVGSVEAAEMIRKYFRTGGLDIPLVLDKESNAQALKGSPILIGNARNNASTKTIFKSGATESFAYRLSDANFAWVNIKKPLSNEETKALQHLGAKFNSEGDFLTPRSELTIGIVTRMPNPKGSGAMTFIASDANYVASNIAAALTVESELRKLFVQMGWRLDQPVPERFEMMFLVTLWPGGLPDKGTDAKLICWRPILIGGTHPV